jgi:uncharacterized OB-fold protein
VSDFLEPQEPGIPLPRPGLFSRPYWDAAREKRLTYQRCRQCGQIPRLPSRSCVACQGGELEWLTSSGMGRLYSWTVVWRPQHPSFKVPYAPAVMAVDEGWWLMTSVIGIAPAGLRDGLPLQVEFHPAGGDIWLPYARPLEDAGA